MKLYHDELRGGLADVGLDDLKEAYSDGKERVMLGLSNLMLEYYAPDPAPDPKVRMTYDTADADLSDWKDELEASRYTAFTRERAGTDWRTYRDGADRVEFRDSEVVVEFEETIDDIPGYHHLDDLDRIAIRSNREDDLFIEFDTERPRHFGSDNQYRIK